jgi:parallel beta-helix repeat protein
MKRFIALSVAIALSCFLSAEDWYFAESSGGRAAAGDPSGAGTGPERPLKGAPALAEKLRAAKPGDRIFLKRGDVFRGALVCAAKGTRESPILISAYGEGPAPVVTDLMKVSSWKNAGKNLWKAGIRTTGGSAKRPSMLLRDGVQLALGRYPNADAPWGGYLPIIKHEGKEAVTSSSLSGGQRWDGAETVLRSRRWILDRLRVKSHEGAVLRFERESTYEPYDGFGFFIQDHPAALDAEGEWCFDSGKGEIILYSSTNPGKNVYEYPAERFLMNAGGSAFLAVEGIEFRGSDEFILDASGTEGVSLKACVFARAGSNAVFSWNARGLSVEDCEFRDSQNNAFRAIAASGLRLVGNRFERTALKAGMGAGADGQYNAIDVSGDDMLIEGNTVERTGYLPIAFNGDGVMVRRNLIDGYALVKDDAGGIYTWSDGKKPAKKRFVVQNLVRNGVGAPDGQSWLGSAVQGIYMDDRTSDVVIEGNLIYGVGESGIFIHNAHEIEIKGNILFDNGVQIQFAHDSIAPDHPIKNVTVTGNVLYSASAGQFLARFMNWEGDEEPEAEFSLNRYMSPFMADNQFAFQGKGTPSRGVDLSRWTGKGGRDSGGTAGDAFIEPFTVTKIGADDLIKDGAFAAGLSSWGWWANYGAGKAEKAMMNPPGKAPMPAARLSFSKASGKADSLFLFHSSPFALRKDHRYRLRFSARSSHPGVVLSFLTRKGEEPWTQSSEEHSFALGTEVREYERYFVSSLSEPLTRAEFTVLEAGMAPLAPLPGIFAELGAIDIREVEAKDADPKAYIRFHPNFTETPVEMDLEGNYVDAQGRKVSGRTTIPAFSAGIFMKDTAAR